MASTTTYVIIGVVVILLVALAVYAYQESEAFCNCSGMGTRFNRPTNTFWRGAWPASFSALPLNFTSAYGTYPQGCSSASAMNDFGWPQSSARPFARGRMGDYASAQPYGIGANEARDFMRDARDGLLNNASVQYSFGQTPIALANPDMVARNMMYGSGGGNMMMANGSGNMRGLMTPSVYGPSTVMQLQQQRQNAGPQWTPRAGAGPVRSMPTSAMMSQAPGSCSVNLPTFTGADCCACGTGQQQSMATTAGYGAPISRFVPLTSIPGALLPPGAVTDSVPCAQAAAAQLRFGNGRYADVRYGDGRYNDIAVGVL
jgi:hypothetical protein